VFNGTYLAHLCFHCPCTTVQSDLLQDKVRNLELALSHLEAISAARIDEVVTLAQKEIATHKAEKDAAHTTLCTLRTDLALTEQMKTQLAEYTSLEELRANEVQMLQARVKALSENQQLLQNSLDASRAREDELQRLIAARAAEAASGTIYCICVQYCALLGAFPHAS
jgi:TolA-binding protein